LLLDGRTALWWRHPAGTMVKDRLPDLKLVRGKHHSSYTVFFVFISQPMS
jgi:hypothetical protein